MAKEKRFPVIVYNTDTEANDEYPIVVIVNGHQFSIKPGAKVNLPASAIEALEHAAVVVPKIEGVTEVAQIHPRFIVTRLLEDAGEATTPARNSKRAEDREPEEA